MKKKYSKPRSKKTKPNYLVLFLILIIAAMATYIIFDKKLTFQPIKPTLPKIIPLPQTNQPETADDFTVTANVKDFLIGGFGMDATAEQIENLFGEPLEVKRSSETSYHNPDYNMYFERWIFPDIEIEFITNEAKGKPAPETPGSILNISATSNLYPTHRKIRVGDPLEKVFKAYGKAKLEDGVYTYSQDLSYIEFSVSNGKVLKITLGHWLD